MRPMRMAMGLAGVILLSSCVVVDEGPVQPQQPQLCTAVIDPVCAQRGGEQREFRNACEARVDGFRVLYRGACRANVTPEPQVCPTIYQPVCARRGNIERTFPNGCQADASGFRISYPGECGTGIDPGVSQPGPGCPRIMAPVCARLGNDMRTFNNSCEAESQGYEVLAERACRG